MYLGKYTQKFIISRTHPIFYIDEEKALRKFSKILNNLWIRKLSDSFTYKFFTVKIVSLGDVETSTG